MDFCAFPEERHNSNHPSDRRLSSAGSGSRLLRIPRSLSKEHVNPVNPVRQYFFQKSNVLRFF
jgi:hypothetical protein